MAMRIEAKICISKSKDRIPCVCEKTGIASALEVPSLGGMKKGNPWVFEYIHPLSYWSNAQGLVKAGRSYLEGLEDQVLAGLVLTAYEHYGLVDKYELSAVEANKILCTASKDTLVELVVMASLFNAKNTAGTPCLSLEWKEVRNWNTIDRQLDQYLKTLRAEFINPMNEGRSEADRSTNRGYRGYGSSLEDKITVLNKANKDASHQGRSYSNGVVMLSSKQTMLDHEKEFEVTFKGAKREGKELSKGLYDQGLINAKFKGFLDAVFKDRNLVAMGSEIRLKVMGKLKEIGSIEGHRLADLIRQCENPYDIFAKVDEQLERASDSFVKIDKPKSLKEILEAKKLARLNQDRLDQSSEGEDSGQLKGLVGQLKGSEELKDSEDQLKDEVDELASIRILEDQDEELSEDEELSDEEPIDDLVDRIHASIYGSKEF